MMAHAGYLFFGSLSLEDVHNTIRESQKDFTACVLTAARKPKDLDRLARE
jgi:hypothetical protein